MAFDWSTLLALAEELCHRDEEAAQRTAISRSYYYVYHLGRRRILDNGFPFSRGVDTHKQVWEKFGNDPDPRCQSLKALAKILQDKRSRADYEDEYAKLTEDCTAVLEMAKQFATKLNALDKRLPVNRGVRF